MLFAGDINKMASMNRTTEEILRVLTQTGAVVRGLAPRETEVELDEPCVMFLYFREGHADQALEQGLYLAACYGARPVALIRRNSSDPHHPVLGELSLRWAKNQKLRPVLDARDGNIT